MKKLMRFAGLLLLLVVVAAVGVVLSIDVLARAAIEKGATDALGVPTTLRTADVGLLDGTFALAGLEVANPPGFDDRTFLSLRDGNVAVTLGSLRADTVELPTLHLTGIDVSLENRSGSSNYQVILDHLKRQGSGDTTPTPSEGGRTYIVREVLVRDVNVRVDLLPVGGELTTIDVPIEEIRLTDVGSESDRGVLLRELSGVIVTAVLEAVTRKLPDVMRLDLERQLAQLDMLDDLGVGVMADLGAGLEEVRAQRLEQIESAVGDVTKAADEIGKNVEGALEDLEKGLGGLLGGNEDPDGDRR